MEESNAPYNDNKRPIMVNVCVSVTLHKSVRVSVSDYEEINYGKDEGGWLDIETKVDTPALIDAVKQQIELPQEKVKGWCVDEFEVVEE